MEQLHRCGVSVYPALEDPEEFQAAQEYIRLAHDLGYHEVFSSLHLPEQDCTSSLGMVRELGEFVDALGMEWILDISGKMLRRILEDPVLSRQMREIPLHWLRLDYGVTPEETCRLARTLQVPGLMLNASVLSRREVDFLVPTLRRMEPQMALRAHHNFYPRPETGLSMEFMVQRSRQYLPYGVPVTACVASLQHPRLPLGAGLPTVEAHRNAGCLRASRELLATGVVDDLLIGDPFASKEELQMVADACRGVPLAVRFVAAPGITGQEREIVFGGIHHARPDEAADAIRSQTSREMATPGAKVPARPQEPRRRLAVTVDNENYQRYSGELQLVTRDLPGDPRVNVAGWVHPDDAWKVAVITPGSDFYFTE